MHRTAAAPQHGPHACDELARPERLHEVIVGAHLEPDDAIDLLAFGRQHQDRHVVPGANAPADRQPVLAWQHQVENDQVGTDAAENGIHRNRILGFLDAKAFADEQRAYERADLRIVLDDENDLRLGLHARVVRPPAPALKSPRPCVYKSIHIVDTA